MSEVTTDAAEVETPPEAPTPPAAEKPKAPVKKAAAKKAAPAPPEPVAESSDVEDAPIAASAPVEIPAEKVTPDELAEARAELAAARADADAARADAEAARAEASGVESRLAALETRPAPGALDDDEPEMEVWQSRTRSREQIYRTGAQGEKAELIGGMRRFTILAADRRRTSARYTNKDKDPFHNGTFMQVSAVTGDPESVAMASRDDVITDERLHRLLHDDDFRTFEQTIVSINNPVIIDRLMEMGEEGDGAPYRRMVALKARQAEMRPRVAELRTPPPGWKDPNQTGDLPPPQQPDMYGGMPQGTPASAGF